MRFVTRAACAVLLTLAAYVSTGCSDKGTEPEKDKPSPTWRHQWSKRFGDASGQYARAVAADTSGNSIVTGYFYGAVDFGGGALTSAGAYDIFLAKLGPAGAHVWSKRFGDGDNQFAPAVAIDGLDNVFVAGYFRGAMDFGGGPLTSAGGEDIFLAKFDSGGGHQWSKRFGDISTDQEAWGVAIDGSGNAIIAGYFTGAVDFGGGALPNAGPNADIFVAKFGSDGAHVWSKSFGDTYAQTAYGVAVDPSDNVLVAGGFNGPINFGGGTLTSAGYKDAFLAKLSPGGAHIWSKRFGDADFQDAHAVTTDVSGNAFIAGNFSGAINFGGGTFASAGSTDIFLAKFGL